jgi:KDO2-lipid IV(A) lauroyltransferase
MENVAREMLRKNESLKCTVFIADQTPPPDAAYWINFLNQETPFFQGAEKLARKLQYPVVYAVLKKRRRGHYEIFIEVLSENASAMNESDLTLLFAQRLQRDVLEEPSQWLWSHRRWKHKRIDD